LHHVHLHRGLVELLDCGHVLQTHKQLIQTCSNHAKHSFTQWYQRWHDHILHSARLLFEWKSEDYCFQAPEFKVHRQVRVMLTCLTQGFRMTVGNPTTSTLADAKGHAGLRFVCLTDKATRFPELPDFPTKPCKDGIMTVHHFPS